MIGLSKYWLIKNRVHFIAWAVFIVIESVSIGLSYGVFGHPLVYATHYLTIILLFYFHALVVYPWSISHFRHAFWRVPVSLTIEIGLFISLSFAGDLLLSVGKVLNTSSPLTLDLRYSMRSLYRGAYFLGFSTGYYYLLTYIREKRKTDELERQKLQEIIQRQQAEEEAIKAQNAFLIAQINPHVFFNTLDYLYHNLLALAPPLADAVSSLAGMMRFALNADKIGGVIRLGDEIEQVENLIYLHQIRQPLSIELDVSEEVEDAFIIPLVILTLTENIFKHGNLTDETQPAKIRIYWSDSYLHIETSNVINQIIASVKSNTGLINIHKRLSSAYPNSFEFSYGNHDSIFFVNIKIAIAALHGVGIFSYPLTDTDTR